MPSAGIRTVRLCGRAKQITFHVFDPRMIEDILDRDVVDEWREEDAVAAAENRRRAEWKSKITRSLKNGTIAPSPTASTENADAQELPGWQAFERDGLLR